MNWKNEAMERLRKYDAMCLAADNNPREIRRLEEEATAIRSARTDGNYIQANGSRREEVLLENMMRRQELHWQLDQTQAWLISMNKAIGVLTPEEKLVLHRFYMYPEKGSVEKLCQEMGLESSSVYRKRDKALRQFTIALYGSAEN